MLAAERDCQEKKMLNVAIAELPGSSRTPSPEASTRANADRLNRRAIVTTSGKPWGRRCQCVRRASASVYDRHGGFESWAQRGRRVGMAS
jgi:hypothetical protein